MIRAIFDYFGWWKPSNAESSPSIVEKRKHWYENGQLRLLEFYRNGKREGKCKMWHSNGRLKEYKFFRDDKPEGEYKSWYSDGFPQAQRYYQSGKLQGVNRVRFRLGEGQLSIFLYFRNGEHIGTLSRNKVQNIAHMQKCIQRRRFQDINYFLIPDLVQMVAGS